MKMINNPTDYTITKCGDNRIVWKGSIVVAKGFTDDESALHAVWVLEEKNPNHFYAADDDGVIVQVNRDEL